ncbi:hypothetical protein ABK040_005578 [Willaertia magna]
MSTNRLTFIDEGRNYNGFIEEEQFKSERKQSLNLYQCIINYDKVPNVYRTKLCKPNVEWVNFKMFIKNCVYNRLNQWSYVSCYPELDILINHAPLLENLIKFLKAIWTYKRFFNDNQLELVENAKNIKAPYRVNGGYAETSFSFGGRIIKVKVHHLLLFIEQNIVPLNNDDGSHLNHDRLSKKLCCEDHSTNISRNPCVGPCFELFQGSKSFLINWNQCPHSPHCEWSGQTH